MQPARFRITYDQSQIHLNSEVNLSCLDTGKENRLTVRPPPSLVWSGLHRQKEIGSNSCNPNRVQPSNQPALLRPVQPADRARLSVCGNGETVERAGSRDGMDGRGVADANGGGAERAVKKDTMIAPYLSLLLHGGRGGGRAQAPRRSIPC